MGNTGAEIPRVEVETDWGSVTLSLQDRGRINAWSDLLTINRVEYRARFNLVTESAWLSQDQFRSRVNGSISSGMNPAGYSARLNRVSPIWPHWSIDFDQSWHALTRLDDALNHGSDSARKVLVTDILDTLAIRLQGMGTELDEAETLARARFADSIEDRVTRLNEILDGYRAIKIGVLADGWPIEASYQILSELGDNPRPWLIEAMTKAMAEEADNRGLRIEAGQ